MALTLIDSEELTVAQSQVTFTGITTSYNDLVIYVFLPTGSSIRSQTRFNGVTSPGIVAQWYTQNGGTLDGFTSYGIVLPYASTTINNGGIPFQYVIELPNYASTGDKSVYAYCAAVDPTINGGQLPSSLYSSITSVQFEAVSATYPIGSTFEIYGRN